MSHTTLGERLEAMIALWKTNPYRLAKDAGLDGGYVRDILRGKVKDPSAVKMLALSRALRCDVVWLIEGCGAEAERQPVPTLSEARVREIVREELGQSLVPWGSVAGRL